MTIRWKICLAAWCFNVCYALFLCAVCPVILYRVFVLKKYREGWKAKWFGHVPVIPESGTNNGDAKRIWLHAVSVGEVHLIKPLLRRIAEKHPLWQCIISTTSSTGFEVARKLYADRYTVFFAPFDFSWAVRTALSRLKPDMLILAEQEIWPNLIMHCKAHGIKLALINGRLSEDGFRRYSKIRRIWQRVMRQFDLVCVQSETYADWFRHLGAKPESVHVTGSLKFDNAQTDRNNPATQSLRQRAGVVPEDIVFLAGSTQEPEEDLAVSTWLALRESHPHLRLILVPRHPERFESVAQLLNRRIGTAPQCWLRRSELPHESKTEEPCRTLPILVDTVGELGAWWGMAKIAFVGGSMGTRGGQNMLEPAAYGAAVSFGSKTKNFRDIVSLMLADDAAVVVRDGNELTAFVRRCLDEPDFAETLGQKAQHLVQRHLGATAKTLALLEAICYTTTH
ncbi:MAG: 3-deoxy-D-manno-octulosonic acid transferase [Planctomycetaceae bacterium]|nr:3-deoxy-D-manno-octulosonic acid transferase [Planctomycetaceae bacterium]